MALTIRLTEEQEAQVERVRGLMGEGARSRTLLRAVGEYEKLHEENQQLRERVGQLEDWLGSMREARRARAEASAARDRADDELAELERQAEEDLRLPEPPRRGRYGVGREFRAH